MTGDANSDPLRRATARRHMSFRVAASVATVVVGAVSFASGGPWQVSPDDSLPVIGSGAVVRVMATVYPVLWAVQVVMSCGLAFALVWKAAQRAEARLLVIFVLGLIVPASDRVFRPLDLPDWLSLLFVFGGLWTAAAAFVRFAAVFPHPLVADHVAAAGRGHLRRAVAGVDRASLRPGVPWACALVFAAFIGIGGAFDDTALEAAGAWIMLAGLIAWPLALLQGIRFLMRGYRLADRAARRRALWMVTGLVSAAGILVVALFVAPLLGGALMPLAPAVFELTIVVPILLLPLAPFLVLAGVAVGVFYDGALDPGLVIRRTTIYGALGILGTFAFAAIEELVASFVVDRFGLPDSTGPILAGGTVAVLASLLHDRLRRLAGRRGGARPTAGEGTRA